MNKLLFYNQKTPLLTEFNDGAGKRPGHPIARIPIIHSLKASFGKKSERISAKTSDGAPRIFGGGARLFHDFKFFLRP